MAEKLNSEFNYRTQVKGFTIWEKIKTLRGFLEGRIRARGLEEVGDLRLAAKVAKAKYLESLNDASVEHEILELKADILEAKGAEPAKIEAYELNKMEVEILEKILKEFYAIGEPTRIEGYTDEQMFEANAANEFTVMIAKELQSQIICTGRPSPASVLNAMSNPITFNACLKAGLIPKGEISYILGGNDNPSLPLELKCLEA